jgi:O-antigen/teichoic acid export membrane protein
MSSVQRSIFFSAIERYGGLLLFFISTAILSRLLTPMEFGIYAVVNAVVAIFAASFQEFGGANYLIQKEDLTDQDTRTAFTVTVCISIVLALVLVFFGKAFVVFFKQSGLDTGMAVAALNFLLTPFSVVVSALLRRQMAFGKLTLCSLIANSVGAAVSIALAVLNFSFMAPIWGGVAMNFVLTILLVATSHNIRIFKPSLWNCSDVLKFGMYSGGVSLINVFYNLSPQLFLGRILDFSAVGLYSRAIGVTQVFDKLVGQVLGPVIMPAIFAENRAGTGLRKIYLDSVTLLSAVQWPALTFLAIMAHPIILIWLGSKWLDIVPLVQLLCIANLALFAACLTYPVLVAVGHVRDALISSLISLPPSLLLIFAASFISIEAVAASALLTLPLQAFVAIYFVSRHLDIKPEDLLRAIFKSALVTFVSVIPAIVCAALVAFLIIQPIVGLALACFGTATCWLMALIATRHPLLPLLQQAGSAIFGHLQFKFALPLRRNAVR